MGIRPPPFSLRLTFEQRAQLERDAGDMSLGGYIQSRLFDPKNPPPRRRSKNPVKDHKALAQVLGQLGQSRLSANLNQLARAAHTGSLPVAANAIKPLNERKQDMTEAHAQERKALADKQRERHLSEQQARSARVRTGAKGVWDIMTGRYFKVRKQNEVEAFFGLQRDRAQRHDLISAQLKERQGLQSQIVTQRERSARQVLGLYRDAAQYRRMMRDGQFDRDGSEQSRPAVRPAPRGPELGR